MVKKLLRCWSVLVHVFSAEALLTYRANGGSVIALRSLLITAWVYAAAIGASAVLDLRGRFAYVEWFGAVFAAVYAGLYSRFASQWVYLAGVYNSIKQAETQVQRDSSLAMCALADWKAGFIEDALELHLATKSIFAPVILVWGSAPEVTAAFKQHTPGGESFYRDLMETVREACDHHGRRTVRHHFLPKPA